MTNPHPPVLQSFACFLVLCVGSVPTVAQDMPDPAGNHPLANETKSDFTLFNPTPRYLWRELSADRPDVTESPYTVDAGAVQLELSFVDYVRNGDRQVWTAAPVNLKLGLLNNVDLQFVLDPYTSVHVDGDDDEHGFGGTQFRLKINVFGNDEEGPALGIMPFISLPTATDELDDDRVEGGIIVPFAVDLSERAGLGLMFETDFVYDAADDAYDMEFVGTAAIGVEVTDRLGWYIEAIGVHSTDAGADFQPLLGSGLTYSLRPDVIVDGGIIVGLGGDADDINLFTGVTIRF